MEPRAKSRRVVSIRSADSSCVTTRTQMWMVSVSMEEGRWEFVGELIAQVSHLGKKKSHPPSEIGKKVLVLERSGNRS